MVRSIRFRFLATQMTRDTPGDLIDLKRKVDALCERVRDLSRQQQLFMGWVDRTQLKLDEADAEQARLWHELSGVCGQVDSICEALCGEETSDGETVN
jgi:cell division FtsZ-interacting protein ZapD